jgi:hypothetical protein
VCGTIYIVPWQRPPQTITLDDYAASHRAVRELKAEGSLPTEPKLRSSKYLNNLIEQDHRSVKQRVAVMLGFKQFRNAAITIAGIELMHRIRKGQFDLRRLGVQGGLRPESGTRYSEPKGSAADPTRLSACRTFAPHLFYHPGPATFVSGSCVRANGYGWPPRRERPQAPRAKSPCFGGPA